VRRSARLVLLAAASTSVATALALAMPATAAPTAANHPSTFSRVGSTVHLAKNATVNTRTSGNWFGYVQGTLEKPGHPLFKSIAGRWVVPTATQHKAGESEDSSTWIGIGGGCVNANCLISDNTLIQTGTEQDVDASGHASYHSWWEIIPAPSISTPLVVHPGNLISASITQKEPGVWLIALHNISTGGTWSQTIPYSSDYLTAEWVDETPLTTGGLAALPKLTPTHFDRATVNGANAHLVSGERLYLTNNSGNIIGSPSVPQSDRNGFGDCTWTTSCAVPSNF
jgi:hypothetical protein